MSSNNFMFFFFIIHVVPFDIFQYEIACGILIFLRGDVVFTRNFRRFDWSNKYRSVLLRQMLLTSNYNTTYNVCGMCEKLFLVGILLGNVNLS